ncbi:MAG: NUDIX domain-containing protein [Candidatus Paceibacterota bacterium]
MNKKEKSCGVILMLRKDNSENKFLILLQTDGHWSFPKGNEREGETARETALRELKEETGIIDIEFTELPNIINGYSFERNGEEYDKTVELFVAFAKNDKVVIQESEVLNYKWATYQEALDTLSFESTKNVLKTTQKYLENMLK